MDEEVEVPRDELEVADELAEDVNLGDAVYSLNGCTCNDRGAS